MKTHAFLAVVFVAATASAQTNVVVTAGSPLLKANADMLRRVTVEAIGKYAPDKALTVSIAVVPVPDPPGIGDASINRYWAIESSSVVSTAHAVPLVGGTYPQVGFLPTVSTTGGTTGYAPGTVIVGAAAGSLAARYVIADATGRVIESWTIPLAASHFVAGSLDSYRDTGAYIAKRLAKLQ